MTKRIIQCTNLGNFGRFGNQLFQYAFARAYAEKYEAELEIPYWIGEQIFKNVSHSKPSCSLPIPGIDIIPWGSVNINLLGYFQTKNCFDIISESKLREWFSFQDRWMPFISENKQGNVAHHRSGDYFSAYSDIFCIINKESYIQASEKYRTGSLEWVSEEAPTINNDVNDVCYKKVKNSMYGSGAYEDDDVSFLPDFFKMINAKNLFRANSTFSFWAAFFNTTGEIYSPVVKGLIGANNVNFVDNNYSAICNQTDDIIFGE